MKTKIIDVTTSSGLRGWYISEGFNDLTGKPVLSETGFTSLAEVPGKKATLSLNSKP